MRKDKEKAFRLRGEGRSYKQIQRELGIPTSTLAGWFKNEPWSQNIKSRLSAEISWSNPRALELLTQANRERWSLQREEYRITATKEFKRYKDNPLFLAGIMLYWGQGEKQPKSSQVRLANSEPEMIRVFNHFLVKTLGISSDKVSARLLLYPDLVESVQKNFWSKTTDLSIRQFKKSAYIKSKNPKKRLSYGVCTLAVNSRALKERMLKWLELSQDYLRLQASTLEN